MDNTLILNDVDFSNRLNMYSVTHELISPKIITTADNVEHLTLKKFRTVIRFTLDPMSDQEAENDFDVLSDGVFTAIYTDPYAGSDRTQTVHLMTNLDAVFIVKSSEGRRYYNGNELEVRAITPGLGEEVEDDSEEEPL